VAAPVKFGLGVKTMLPPTIATVPPTGLETAEMLSVSPASTSVSLPSSVAGRIVTGVSSPVVTMSLPAFGASCTGVTFTLTVTVLVPPLPSLIV
jgi:hypothetical protein